nr:HA [Granville quaranjavirus]
MIDPHIQQSPVSNEIHVANIFTQQATIKGTIGYRSRYTAYCYEGGLLDPNTGCYKSHKMIPPTEAELSAWSTKGKCSYGQECPKKGTCWAKESDKCFDTRTELNWSTSKEYQNNNDDWMLFARHTCISSWRCGVHDTVFPLYLVMRDGVPRSLVYDSKGRPLDAETPYHSLNPETALLLEKLGPVLSFKVDANCYQQKDSPLTCQLPSDNKLGSASGLIIDADSEGFGHVANIIVKIEINKEHPNDSKDAGRRGVTRKYKTNKIAAAVSIEDLRPVLISMVYEAGETNFNLFQLLRAIRELTVMMRKVIESTSKLDDELIGKVIGVQTKTKWFNDRLFHLCPCYQIPRETNGNCADHFIYKEGRYVPETENSRCSSYSEGSITPLNLTRLFNLTFSTLSFPPPRGTSSSWEGWSWLAEQKENLIDTMAFKDETTSPTSGNPLSKFYNEELGFFSFWTIWSRYMPFVTLITFFMALYSILRK